jgi:single-strand DNA-binding protein
VFIIGVCYIRKVQTSYNKKRHERRNLDMMNSVNLVGRLTKDPELRYTPNGVAVANFTLAVNRPWTDDNGERDADFIQCVVWRRTAEVTADYTKKGSQVGIQGRIQTRTYENDEGKTVYVTEVLVESIHFLEKKEETENRQQTNNRSQNNNRQTNRGGRR